MPITREALARLERFLDAVEEAHEAEISEETLAKTDAEIDAELRAWGIDVDQFVEDLRRGLGLDADGSVAKQHRAEAHETATDTKRSGGKR